MHSLIRGIDALLRRAYGVFEFSTSDHCLLRIAIARSRETVRFSNGVLIECGDPIATLHLWNEHLPPFPENGPNFAWVARVRQQMFKSLAELAVYAESAYELENVHAFHARIAVTGSKRREKVSRIGAHFGFERVVRDSRRGLGYAVHQFFENFLLWGLAWTFNPRSLRRRALIRQRDELWISKVALIRRYGRHGYGVPHTGGPSAVAPYLSPLWRDKAAPIAEISENKNAV